VTEIPGRGMGVIALQNLQPGTVILKEAPVIVIDGRLTNFNRIQSILQSFGDLCPEDQRASLELYDAEDLHTGEYLKQFPEFEEELEMRKIVRIFDMNNFEVCVDKAKFGIHESGLYPKIARINHSCAPNVIWTWKREDASHRVKMVTVCRPIEEGEEIVLSYIQLADFPAREERIHRLKTGWYFNCDCQVCCLEGSGRRQNEIIRSRIRDLNDQHSYLVKEGKIEEALERAEEKIQLMESIKNESILTLPFALLEVCDLATHLGLVEKAKDAREQALTLATLFGDRHLSVFD